MTCAAGQGKACPIPDTTSVRSPRTVFGGPELNHQRQSGSELPSVQLLENVDVEDLVVHDLFEIYILLLGFLQTLDVIGIHLAILGSPAVPGRIGDLQVAGPYHSPSSFPAFWDQTRTTGGSVFWGRGNNTLIFNSTYHHEEV